MDRDKTDLKFQSYTLLVLVFVVQELKTESFLSVVIQETRTEQKLMIFF